MKAHLRLAAAVLASIPVAIWMSGAPLTTDYIVGAVVVPFSIGLAVSSAVGFAMVWGMRR